jgi:hypothetical protein
MGKNNQTAVTLSVLVVLGLFSIAAGLAWVGYQLTQSKSNSTNTTTSTTDNPSANASVPTEVSSANASKLDYSKLQEDLQKKDWKAADRDTYELMLQTAGPKAQAKGFTPKNEMATLSCTVVKQIDDFWTKASGGQQGFSVQQDILKAQGDYRKMYAQVGWQAPTGEWLIDWNYNPQSKRMEYKPGKEPNFKNPPPGHLPTVERGYNFDVSINEALTRCGI